MAFLWRYFPVAHDIPQSIVEHLEEFRRRVLWAVAGLLFATFVGLWQQNRLLLLLMRPAGLTHLIALTVLEPMLVKFKVAVVFGLILAFPWLLLQALMFVSPALTEREARHVVPITALSVALSVVGVVFGYLFVLPPSTRWLLNQAGSVMSVQITALSYVSYATLFLAALAVTFQTPLVVLTLIGLRLTSRAQLRRQWRTVYMTITVLAAVVTPDWGPVSMLLGAAGSARLFELSLALAPWGLLGPEPTAGAGE